MAAPRAARVFFLSYATQPVVEAHHLWQAEEALDASHSKHYSWSQVSVLLSLASHLKALYAISDIKQRNFKPEAAGASKAEKVLPQTSQRCSGGFTDPLFLS